MALRPKKVIVGRGRRRHRAPRLPGPSVGSAASSCDCPDENAVLAFLLGEGSLDGAFDEHMDRCAFCRRIVSELARTLRQWICSPEE
jgi:hypothetical protein